MLMQMMADGGEEGDDDMEGMETGGMMEGADVVELSAGEMEAVERVSFIVYGVHLYCSVNFDVSASFFRISIAVYNIDLLWLKNFF